MFSAGLIALFRHSTALMKPHNLQAGLAGGCRATADLSAENPTTSIAGVGDGAKALLFVAPILMQSPGQMLG